MQSQPTPAEYEAAMTFDYTEEDMKEDNLRYEAEVEAHKKHIDARTYQDGCSFCDDAQVTNEEGIED